jgi:hypothetical protein
MFKKALISLFLLLLVAVFFYHNREISINETTPNNISMNEHFKVVRKPSIWQSNCSNFVEYRRILPFFEEIPKGNRTRVNNSSVLIKDNKITIIFGFYGAGNPFFNLTTCAYENETLFLKFYFYKCDPRPSWKICDDKECRSEAGCFDILAQPVLEINPKVKIKTLVVNIWGEANYSVEISLDYR